MVTLEHWNDKYLGFLHQINGLLREVMTPLNGLEKETPYWMEDTEKLMVLVTDLCVKEMVRRSWDG